MKKLLSSLGILILTVFMLIGTSFAYTYDGGIDPFVISGWEQTSNVIEYEPGVEMLEVRNNSDAHPDVDLAVLFIVNGNVIIGFQYRIKSTGKVKYFEFNNNTKNYDEVSGFSEGTFEERYLNRQ